MERLIWVIVSAFLIIRLRCTKKLPLCNDVTLQFIYCFCTNVTAYTSVCVYVVSIFFSMKSVARNWERDTDHVWTSAFGTFNHAFLWWFCSGFFFCLTAWHQFSVGCCCRSVTCDQQTKTISKASTSKGKKITHKFADSATSMKDPVCVIQRLWLVLL